jgi:cytochrome d ubiquinol oxidase subunit II
METLWFCLVAVMIAMYVVLDGFDLGAGIAHLFVARSDAERRQVLASIGPVWDGNEVWLLAGGGTLYFAFPALYASSFSGFYLPLMMVLWLLMLRGLAIEFRNHLKNEVWTPFWDVTFAGASALLAIFFGAALGNVVRGVPLDAKGEFFLPMWTNFLPGADPGILDWFTVLVGVLAFAALAQHGALWLNWKTDGPVQARAKAVARLASYITVLMTVVVTFASWKLQPQILANFTERPFGWIFPVLAMVGIAGVLHKTNSADERGAFLSSALFILGMLTSAAFGIFPMVLPAVGDPARSLTVYNSAAAPYGLRVGLLWWAPGMILASAYAVYTYRRFAGKVAPESMVHGD